MKRPYTEGSVFAVPLRFGGFGIGLVARVATDDSGGVLGYFFGPRYEAVPALESVSFVDPRQALRVVRFGDPFLLNGKWPILGTLKKWDRRMWPMPDFVRKDDLTKTAWRVRYSEENLTQAISETPAPYDSALERAAVFGAGAVELMLTKLLP
jgi:hypothetical protein